MRRPAKALFAFTAAWLLLAVAAVAVARLLVNFWLARSEQADRVLMLDGARIVECGTAHELLERRGQFARLFEPAAAAAR